MAPRYVPSPPSFFHRPHQITNLSIPKQFYKWIKRIVLHRQAMKAGTEGFEDLEDRVFSRYYTDSSSDVANEKQNEKV